MFSIKSKVTSDNKELDRFLSKLLALDTNEVQYGYFAGEEHNESGLDIAHLAEMLNYGTDSILARPFMDFAGDLVERHFQVSTRYAPEIWSYLVGTGAKSITQLLRQFGRVGEISVQGSIDNGDWAENVEWWKQIKFEKYGSSSPLIASQELYDSVKSKVVKVNVV